MGNTNRSQPMRRLLQPCLLLGAALLAGTATGREVAQEIRALREQAALYEHGRGVAQSHATAYRLYCRAALLGDPLSAYNLGWMYFNGRGLSRQPDLAVAWFRRAARAGDVYAARMLPRYAGIEAREDPGCHPEAPNILTAAAKPQSTNPTRRLVETWVGKIATDYAVDPDLVLAVIQVESGFDSRALSNKNAHGLMQLIPATAERFGVKDIWNPQENIKGGTAYLRWLLRRFDGNVAWALAAYNAGERTVEQYQGIPPFRETRHYVDRILAAYPKPLHPVPPPREGHS